MNVQTTKNLEASKSAPVRARGYEPAPLTAGERAASLGSALGIGAVLLMLAMLGVLYIQSVGMFVLPVL